MFDRHLHGLMAVGSLADDLYVRTGQQIRQSRANDFVIIGNQ